MKQDSSRRTHRLLVFGVIFLLLGGSLLLRTTGNLPGAFSLWPTAVVFLGVALLYQVFFRNGRETYIFAGLFLLLVGAFLLILNTHAFDVKFRQIWPFFMLFAGVSLLVYGFKRPKSSRARMMIPAFSIILLSGVFLLFSMDIITISLRRFVVMWWPALFVVTGFFLIGFDFFSNRKPRD